MISDADLPKLVGTICATVDTLGGQITPAAAAMMANDLQNNTLEEVLLALAECRRTLKGRFSLAEVIARIAARDGRPSRDEAWGIALCADDEEDTVVMTSEIQLALAAARPVLRNGDKIGARMAFLSAYDRFVEEARLAAEPVSWLVSMGYDASRRDAALHRAVQLKRLPMEKASLYLTQDVGPRPNKDGVAIAALITGKTLDAEPTPKVREKLQLIKQTIVEAKKQTDEQKGYDAEARRLDHLRRLQEHEALVAGAMQGAAR
jgi:hypothetical protein